MAALSGTVPGVFGRRKPAAAILAGIATFVALLASPLWPEGLTDDDIAALKLRMVEQINADRAAVGAPPVEFDERASRVGDLFCAQALAEGARGHFTLDGIPPYLRYALAGGTAYSAENVSAWWYTGQDYGWTVEKLWDVMAGFQQKMLAEQPPHDGHRRTLLNPYHTHVGIGLAVSPNGLRMAQEFLSRYVAVGEIPFKAKLSDKITFVGKVLDPERFQVFAATIHHEAPPAPLTLEEANARMQYEYPEHFRVLRPLLPEGQYYADTDSRGEILVKDDGTFAFRVPFLENRPGYYGIMVILKPKDDSSAQVPATYVCIEAE